MTLVVSTVAAPWGRAPKGQSGASEQSARADWLWHRGERTAWRPGLPRRRHHACADSAPRISEPSMPATAPPAWTFLREAATVAFPGLSHMLLGTQRRGGTGAPMLSCGSLLRVKVSLLPLPPERFLCYWLEPGEPFHLLVIASSLKPLELIFMLHSRCQDPC